MSIVTYNNRSIANISAIPGAAKSLTHIKTITASGDGTINFVNGSSDVTLDSTFPIYIFKIISLHPSGSDDLQFQCSTDGGSNYNTTVTSSYFRAYHNEGGSATALEYQASKDQGQGTSYQVISESGPDNDHSTSGTLTLFNPSSTTFVKHWMSEFNFVNSSDYSMNTRGAGYFNTTSAINAVSFKFASSNLDLGNIKLYGLKDS
tara:strand:+ start:137 stop:751 length:615 start_codon:yes stop_codon:yes gene_type:complete